MVRLTNAERIIKLEEMFAKMANSIDIEVDYFTRCSHNFRDSELLEGFSDYARKVDEAILLEREYCELTLQPRPNILIRRKSSNPNLQRYKEGLMTLVRFSYYGLMRSYEKRIRDEKK